MKRKVVDEKEIAALVTALADSIAARGGKNLVLVGIKRRGVPLAHRIARAIEQHGGKEVPVGAVDITLYRDDLQLVAETPIVRGTEIEFDINGRRVVLVDDVVYTGRTVRAALTELLEFGRPRSIELAVLIDRGHRELPIEPNHVGRSIETKAGDLVDILLKEEDGSDAVYVEKR